MSARLPNIEKAPCTSKTCKWEMRTWTAGRGGKFAICSGCGTRFPCAGKKCKHGDCAETRERLGTS